METKVCKRCGKEQSVDQFRAYYGGKKGLYNFCKTCEKIDQRRKYLARKDSESPDGLSSDEQIELDKINELYAARQAAGLSVPIRRSAKGVTNLVDQLLTDME